MDNSRQLPCVSFILPTPNIEALLAGHRTFNAGFIWRIARFVRISILAQLTEIMLKSKYFGIMHLMQFSFGSHNFRFPRLFSTSSWRSFSPRDGRAQSPFWGIAAGLHGVFSTSLDVSLLSPLVNCVPDFMLLTIISFWLLITKPQP